MHPLLFLCVIRPLMTRMTDEHRLISIHADIHMELLHVICRQIFDTKRISTDSTRRNTIGSGSRVLSVRFRGDETQKQLDTSSTSVESNESTLHIAHRVRLKLSPREILTKRNESRRFTSERRVHIGKTIVRESREENRKVRRVFESLLRLLVRIDVSLIGFRRVANR